MRRPLTLTVIAVLLFSSLAARADDVAGADAELDEGALDVYGGVSFCGRVVGLPAIVAGGVCLGAGMHALAVSGALGTSGLGSAAYWTNFGGTIAMAVAILPLVIGEVGLLAAAIGDLLTAVDLTAAESEGSGLAWVRVASWEAAAHAGAAGAGLTGGGLLALISTIVLPSIFAFDAAGANAYSSLFGLTVVTAGVGVATLLVAAALGGISVWLGGATESAYRRSAKAAPATRSALHEGAATSTLGMAY